VRRAEGRFLHPRRDARGVFQFDPAEVRELRQATDRGAVRLSDIDFHSARTVPLRAADRHCGSDSPDSSASLRQELVELYEVSRCAVELLYAVCPDRVLSELDPEIIDAFDDIMNSEAS